MTIKNTNSEIVTFTRGGVDINLHKATDKFLVKLKDGKIIEKVPDKLLSKYKNAVSARFLRSYQGHRSAIFWCPNSERDKIMAIFRQENDLVQYCSHVFQRLDDNSIPADEIGLDNKIYVEFSKWDDVTISKVQSKYGLRAIWHFPEFESGMIFELTSEAKKNPLRLSNDLAKEGFCKYVEPCLIDVKRQRAIPNDPGFSYQWHLLNSGQGGGIPGADCNATSAWDYTWGDQNVTVAVIDDGFDLSHPDFNSHGKIVAPYDATQRDDDPSPESLSEKHGTSCAGVAVASRGGGLTVGIAPDCKLMPIRHSGQLGDYEEALAFYHAYQNSADIISCSWGPWDAYQNTFWPMPSLTQRVIEICVRYGRNGKGIPIFFAAGNGNEPLDLDGYANHPNVIAVAACTNEDEKAPYSDYGKNVWVTAPSSGGTLGITTTDRTGADGYNQMGDYTTDFGGTSSATPLVAGLAALMMSVNPNLTVLEIKDILKNTAVKVQKGNPNTRTDHWGNKYSDAYNADGHSEVYGWGRIDAGAAVKAAYHLLQ